MLILENKIELKTKLREPMAYSDKYEFWALWVFGIVLLIIFIAYVFVKTGLFDKVKSLTHRNKKFKVKSPEKIRNRYLYKIDEINVLLRNNRIDAREGYRRLSELVRVFAYEVTGVKVQNFTLNEIRGMGISNLTELISDFYEPEFAKKTEADVIAGLAKTRKVIEEWN